MLAVDDVSDRPTNIKTLEMYKFALKSGLRKEGERKVFPWVSNIIVFPYPKLRNIKMGRDEKVND